LAIRSASASSVEGDHRQHRPEDFLARDGVFDLHAVE
jgi:hypothetical protein